MEEKIYQLLLEMQKDIKGIQRELTEFKQESNERLSAIDEKLGGAAFSIDKSGEVNYDEIVKLDKRVEKVESALFRLTEN